MIKPLLDYQLKEKEKLALSQSVETGRTKRELDEANRTLDNAKRTLLALENDAKTLQMNFENISRNLGDIFTKVADFSKATETSSTEDEAAAALNSVSALLGKVGVYEQQLSDIAAKISVKTMGFEDAKTAVVKAQKAIATYQAEYDSQKAALMPQVNAIDAELATLAGKVDKILLEKYKKIRKNDTLGKVSDIAVILTANSCGGCHFELPLSLIHTIASNGFIICEECGRIIYK